ncbi:MAG: hypothetical protein GY906_08140 [bacterium]|nr:hypothetical protein [bacterium]
MTQRTTLSESAIESQLQRLENCDLQHDDNGHWTLVIGEHDEIEVDLRVDDGWLRLDTAPPGPTQGHDPWRLVCLNRQLHGTAKLAYPSQCAQVRLRSEIPLDDDVDVAHLLIDALLGIEAGYNALSGATGAAPAGADSDHTIPDSREDVAQLCVTAGWPVRAKGDRTWSTTLACTRTYQQATLFDEGNSGVLVRTDLLHCGELSELCRHALGSVLLSASGSLRMVRASVASGEEESVVGFEVRIPESCSGAELIHALAALSVAGDLCSAEVALLAQSETIAHEYLDLRGQLRENSAVQGG